MFNQKRLLYLLFLSSISIYSTIQCSSYGRLITKLDKHLQKYHQCSSKLMTYEQADDPDLDAKRSAMSNSENFIDIQKIFPKNKLVSTTLIGERPGVCYNAAMLGALGLSKDQWKKIQIKIIGCDDWHKNIRVLHKCFDQVDAPNAGDIACYGLSDKNSDIQHFAIATKNNTFVSKIGSYPFTIEHDLLHINAAYGKVVSFLTLKKQYRNNKQLLFTTLMKKIYQSSGIRRRLDRKRKEFLNSDDDYNTSYALLKRIMGIDIDVCNEKNKTALMIAAKNGRLDLIQLYLEHHADFNLQDNKGNTALIIAAKNNQPRVVEILLAYGADPTIKNNDGKSILTMAMEKRRQF